MSRLRSLVAMLLVALSVAWVQAPADAAAPAAPVDRTSYLLDASYVVHIAFDWTAGSLDVTTDMEADNQSGGSISRLELNTVAAELGHMQLTEASVDGTAVAPRVSGQTLIVTLPQVLKKNGHVSVHTRYRATLLNSVAGHDWLWADTAGVASVYRSIPWLSARKSFKRDNIGDPFVTPVASSVRVTFTSATAVQFATTGTRVASTEPGVTYEAHDVRDFNFTASRKYVSLSGKTLDGQTRLLVMTRWASSRQQQHMLDVAQRAIAQYDTWVGKLPCPMVTIAETAGGSAMESPCLIWIPQGAGANVDYLIAHELGHQWFYGVVGNDQAADPFFDEGMTDFLARTFLHQLRASRCAEAPLDMSIYQYSGPCYYETIYIQGSLFLKQLKQTMGHRLFWDTLQAFWVDQRYTVSSTFQLLEAFRAAAGDAVLPLYQARFPSLYPH